MDDTVCGFGVIVQLSYTVTGHGNFLNTVVGVLGTSYLDGDRHPTLGYGFIAGRKGGACSVVGLWWRMLMWQ